MLRFMGYLKKSELWECGWGGHGGLWGSEKGLRSLVDPSAVFSKPTPEDWTKHHSDTRQGPVRSTLPQCVMGYLVFRVLLPSASVY